MLGPSVLRTLRAIIIVLIGAALFGTSLPPAMAADGEAARASAAKADRPTAAVEVDGRVLFRLRGVSSMPADERTANVSERIKGLARNPAFDPASLAAVPVGDRYDITAGSEQVLVVTKADGDVEEVGAHTLSTA